jgi:septal ring factor EnvC (AmiA/AmiB activator)
LQPIGKAPRAIIAAIIASVARIATIVGEIAPLNRARPAKRTRSLLAAATLGAILAGLGPLAYAETPNTADDAKKKLESRRIELENAQSKTKELESDVGLITAEREKLNKRLVETADLIKKSEGQLTAIENRLGELGAQEKILRGSLNERQGQIAKLLSALQRMGRNPPPVLITQREDALKMVRSAMLLAAAFPQLGNQAKALAARLTELLRVMTEMRAQSEQLRTETTRLNDAKTRLAGLLDAKKTSLEQRQGELKRMRMVSAEISESVTDLNELITKLDQAVKENTALGSYDKEAKAKEAAATPATPPAPANPAEAKSDAKAEAKPQPDSKPGTTPASEPKTAQSAPGTTPSATDKSVDVVELSPSATLGSPGRIKPEIPFSQARGRLPMPAQGRQVLGFGEKTQYGGQSKGLVLETRTGAQVTSPCDGWIVYAGEFRSYGQLLIINAGGGYHVLLAGLSQIDVQPGQFVLGGEPVGTMSGWTQQAQSATANNAPVLYVEFRKDGTAIDPDPWWVQGHQKVQG